MHYKVIATTLFAASLLGAPAVAYAQSDTAPKGPSASSESNSGAKTSSMKHHKMHHAHMKPGTTTGLSSSRPGGKPIPRKPSGS